jgi:hypothetical protein
VDGRRRAAGLGVTPRTCVRHEFQPRKSRNVHRRSRLHGCRVILYRHAIRSGRRDQFCHGLGQRVDMDHSKFQLRDRLRLCDGQFECFVEHSYFPPAHNRNNAPARPPCGAGPTVAVSAYKRSSDSLLRMGVIYVPLAPTVNRPPRAQLLRPQRRKWHKSLALERPFSPVRSVPRAGTILI